MMQDFWRRRRARMNMPDRIAETLLGLLPWISVEEGLIIIDRARDHVEIEPLGGGWSPIHEKRQTFGTRIREPRVDGQAIAFRLRDFLALFVEEQFITEPFGRSAAERARDRAG